MAEFSGVCRVHVFLVVFCFLSALIFSLALCSQDNKLTRGSDLSHVNMNGQMMGRICTVGFVWNGEYCEDQDECMMQTNSGTWISPCKSNEICINMPGNFVCWACANRTSIDADSNSDEEEGAPVFPAEPKGPCIPTFQVSSTIEGGSHSNYWSQCYTNNKCDSLTQFCIPRRKELVRPTSYEGWLDKFEVSNADENEVDYFCACKKGYRFNALNDRCEDYNECTMNITWNPCSNHTNHICRNTVGSYTCVPCQTGYLKTITNSCVPEQECGSSRGLTCGYNWCGLSDATFACSECPSGYRLTANGTCADVNECEEFSHTCGVHQCVNTKGGFECMCLLGGFFRRQIDGRCVDMDECKMSPSICGDQLVCQNVVGGYHCKCPLEGYELNLESGKCEKVQSPRLETHTNECVVGDGGGSGVVEKGKKPTHPWPVCKENEACVDTQDGYYCLKCPRNSHPKLNGEGCECNSGYYESVHGTCESDALRRICSTLFAAHLLKHEN